MLRSERSVPEPESAGKRCERVQNMSTYGMPRSSPSSVYAAWHPPIFALPQQTPTTNLLPNHVFAAVLAHPHFVQLVRGNVNARARSEGLLLARVVLGITDRELARENEVSGQAAVSVRRVVCIPVGQE